MTDAQFNSYMLEEIKVWKDFRRNVANLVNAYVETRKNRVKYTDLVVNVSELDEALDGMALFRAWIEDRINDNAVTYGSSGYNKTRLKKIRKALGFNF